MKTGIQIGGEASGRHNDWPDIVDYVRGAERLGVDSCWSGEAWGRDAVTPLAYLAACTERMVFGTSIMQVTARAPAMTAMTAMTMAAMSGNRFILGLGVSGPQVVEGLHGVSFEDPLDRLKETVDIIRLAFSGQRLEYDGRHHTLPRPGGEGKALRMAQPPNDQLPIYLATLGPRSLEYTGAVADGWVGTSFSPATANVFLEHIAAGARTAGRDARTIAIDVPAPVAFGDVEQLLPGQRPRLAFMFGAMGSPTRNFYANAYRRAGWTEAVDRVQTLWYAGQRDEAAAAVPDELVLASALLGDDAAVRAGLRAYRDAGVDTVRFRPAGRSYREQLDTVARALELVREVNAEPASA
jgi:F420-dependent oxidoreductase-like protein